MAAMLYPPIRLSALVLAGRSPSCPMGQAVKSEQWRQRTIEAKVRILAASEVVKKYGEIELWETLQCPFWKPSRSKFCLTFHLAEQEMNIYGDEQKGVRKGDIVLDCGANIGTFKRTVLNR